MPIINVTTSFPFAVDGNEVIQIEVGEQEASDRLALVAVEHLEFATLLSGTGASETDPLKMKVEDLRAWLTGKGIDFDPALKKTELQALVPAGD